MKFKMKKFCCIVLLFLISILPLTGCKAKAPLLTEELYALDTIISFTVYSDNQEAVNSAKEEIKRLESLLSVTDENSDIYKINSNPDTFVKVQQETFDLIKTAISVSESSGGNFDITVYPAVKLWGFTTDDYKIPESSELLEVKEKIGYNNIVLDESTSSVKVPRGTELDLGGIAKGYIADKTAEVLTECGVTSALLNFGGNVRLVGSKPEDEVFKIGIKAPFKNGYFAILREEDVTVSTAGGYERFFEENGKKYHHILNPHTASPAETEVLSSTVVGEKGEICDALATASFVSGVEGISELLKAYPNYDFILLTDSSVFVTKRIFENISLTDNFKDLKINII